MSLRFKFDPTQSRLSVHASATGMLSVFAHSPTFRVRQLGGIIAFPPEASESPRIELNVRADSLELQDHVGQTERREIEGRMCEEVLEAPRFPEIVYRAEHAAMTRLGPGHFRIQIRGELDLHGVRRAHPVEAELWIYDEGVQLRGNTVLRMSDHGIRPVTALGGTIRLRDELALTFDLVALPEQP
jgi:polyisoprenoid-binding protein YceI